MVSVLSFGMSIASCNLQLSLPDPALSSKMASRSKERQPPMLEQDNIDLIKKLYAAFGKGDIETIIDHLADQLVWRFDAPAVIPYAGEHDTPDQVKEAFFANLASTQKDYSLQTDEFIAQGDKLSWWGATARRERPRESGLTFRWSMSGRSRIAK